MLCFFCLGVRGARARARNTRGGAAALTLAALVLAKAPDLVAAEVARGRRLERLVLERVAVLAHGVARLRSGGVWRAALALAVSRARTDGWWRNAHKRRSRSRTALALTRASGLRWVCALFAPQRTRRTTQETRLELAPMSVCEQCRRKASASALTRCAEVRLRPATRDAPLSSTTPRHQCGRAVHASCLVSSALNGAGHRRECCADCGGVSTNTTNETSATSTTTAATTTPTAEDEASAEEQDVVVELEDSDDASPV